MNQYVKDQIKKILEEELIVAMGCTEPIALAYACGRAASLLDGPIDGIEALCSGNMIKNARSVNIPNSEGMVGIEAACVLGAVGGDYHLDMDCLSAVTKEDVQTARKLLAQNCCKVDYLDTEIPLHFIITITSGSDKVTIETKYSHLNVTKITKNDEVIYENEKTEDTSAGTADRSVLTLSAIIEYANTVDLAEIKDIFDRQIKYNVAIAQEGLTGKYGLDIGNMILNCYPETTINKMKAWAAAGSEARMAGCSLPVIICSGSGNQGIACSVPVIIYAQENNIEQEKLYRSLCLSALLTLYQKEFIGRLSAFCGAVSASTAAAAAITYMVGGTNQQIVDTIDNTLANIPGIICDGAKTSCAAKIASSIDAAMMSHNLAMNGKAYEAYTGILKADASETISCVGYIGKVGMRQTDKEILKKMLEN